MKKEEKRRSGPPKRLQKASSHEATVPVTGVGLARRAQDWEKRWKTMIFDDILTSKMWCTHGISEKSMKKYDIFIKSKDPDPRCHQKPWKS